MVVSAEHISTAVERAGLAGRCLCVHSSLRSFGHVQGGPETVVTALLGQGCTVMVPTFSWAYAVPPPPGDRPARNGWDYDGYAGPADGLGRVYTPAGSDIDEDMGAIPAAVLAMDGRVRGGNPLCSFAAVGAQAARLIAGQTPLDFSAPLRNLISAGGSIVLMGVDLTRMTALHLAEREAGRRLFRRWANGPGGKAVQVEVGGCSAGFHKFEAVLSPLGRRLTAGRSTWRVYAAGALVDRAAQAIRDEAMLTHCGNPECQMCSDAVAGGPILA